MGVNMNNPKISVITITFNSEKTLEETIKSVINQDYDNIEYLIIDGKSTDGTLNIIEKYKDRIDIVLSEPDNGISDAFNKGIKLATGDIIGIINSDDTYLPGALRAIADSYSPGIDVYRGNTVIWNEATKTKISAKPTMLFPINKRIKSVCHPSTFVAKNAYEKWGGFQEKFRYLMDADLLHRFYCNHAQFKYVEQDLAVFKLGGATSDKWQKKIKEVYWTVIDNGGSKLVAYYKCFRFVFFQILKEFLFKLVGEDKARKYGYRAVRDTALFLFSLLFFWIYIPHLIFAYLGGGRIKIQKDVERMRTRIRISLNRFFSLLFLLHTNSDFRTVFYHRIGPIPSFLIGWYRPGNKYFIISKTTALGEGVFIEHPFATIINAESIGKNFACRNLTTIGNKFDTDGRRPIIGDNVYLGAAVTIIGDVKIGNNAIIGAGSVIIKDVPDNAIVGGNPARVIKFIENGI